MINTLFFVLCLVTISTSLIGYGMHAHSMLNEDSDLKRQLKLVNKSPIKSIHTKFGYIVDCIDIYKQPAFDHPLLKNYSSKLQMKPNFQRINGNTIIKNSPNKLKFGIERYMCPIGTIPIRRTTKDDLIRARSLLSNSNGSHVAEVSLQKLEPYYGASGRTSIFNTRVSFHQTSSSRIFVQNGEEGGTNRIEVGWHISPELYGNYATHVYSRWTSDNFKKTGCYNTLCPGFVRHASEYQVGARVGTTSVRGGPTYDMMISIVQDDKNDWLVNIDDQTIGHFPAALFTQLDKASIVGWGGSTTTPVGTPNPPMGSGYVPDDSFTDACYFRQVTYRDKFKQDTKPGITVIEKEYTDAPACYSVEHGSSKYEIYGYHIHFGGPGGTC